MHLNVIRFSIHAKLVSDNSGDAKYKPYVTARPEIASVELDGDEDFVVVACDGLWDFVSEDQVALSVYFQLAADPVSSADRSRKYALALSNEGGGERPWRARTLADFDALEALPSVLMDCMARG
ncbi:Probable protein phosphatase 2C 14 [Eumeta japonica]|uniref:Probable protein phosphatase 2C 14 n=1 Tax=Eumeta variegata TaxID=151549 RepID=A0A4C2AA93_EUMVA|nr:Probable protein phosphatase 2C 14 [Eumeta japonica]